VDCPACSHPLIETQVEDLTVDVCRGGCGGVWFDNHEIQKVDEAHEHLGEALLSIEHDPSIPVDHDQRRTCPRCAAGHVMMRHFFSVKEQVEVDRCPGCNGTWLDLGELRGIRDAFATEAERVDAAKAHFDQLFGEDLEQLRQESQQGLERARWVAHLLRFITPSWYIPGKQRGGAF
jgi:hypothetical protein